MGCDIHMHVEYRKLGKWYSGDYYRKKGDKYVVVEFYPGRNYDLFAMLADVRNYDYRDYVDSARGLPSDITDDVRNEFEPWRLDAHDCSYLTLKELIDFQEEHKGDSDYDDLNYVIDKLKIVADELYLIYDFEWTGIAVTRQRAYEKSDDIRIVFWFDN